MATSFMREKIAEAKRTGKVLRHIINPADLGSTNPLVGFLPKKPTVMNITPLVPVMVGELIEICKKNPHHPLSAQKRASVFGLPETTVVHILQQDMDSLREDVPAGPAAPKKLEPVRSEKDTFGANPPDTSGKRKKTKHNPDPDK